MNKKTDQRHTSDEDRSAANVKADDPKRSLDRLAALARKILKVPKEQLERLEQEPG